MMQTPTFRSHLVPVLQKDCLQRQEIAQLYKALAKRQVSPQKRELYKALASKSELAILRPARRLSRLGVSVPALKKSWVHQVKWWYISHLNPEKALTWLQQVEARTARDYLDAIYSLKAASRPRHPQKAPTDEGQVRQQMLNPLSRYYGEATPEQVALNTAMQAFSNQVAITCALQTGGKLPSAEAMQRLEYLWQGLQTFRMRQRLAQDLPKSQPD